MSLTKRQIILKRLFDIIFSLVGLIFTFWFIIIGYILATLDTRKNGFFLQTRIGLYGKPFKIIKLRTMKVIESISTTITTDHDLRISKVGRILRKAKIDELVQLINVLKGDMSFVGPRPDVPGYADKLMGEDKIILTIRPGITGPATLYFRNEESLLANQKNPEEYNDRVIYPKKIELNKEYIKNYSLKKDIIYIFETIFTR